MIVRVFSLLTVSSLLLASVAAHATSPSAYADEFAAPRAEPAVDKSSLREGKKYSVLPMAWSEEAKVGVFEVTDAKRSTFNVAVCELERRETQTARFETQAELELTNCRYLSDTWVSDADDANRKFRDEWRQNMEAAYENAVAAMAAAEEPLSALRYSGLLLASPRLMVQAQQWANPAIRTGLVAVGLDSLLKYPSLDDSLDRMSAARGLNVDAAGKSARSSVQAMAMAIAAQAAGDAVADRVAGGGSAG